MIKLGSKVIPVAKEGSIDCIINSIEWFKSRDRGYFYVVEINDDYVVCAHTLQEGHITSGDYFHMNDLIEFDATEQTKICHLINGQFSWILEVDGRKIPFQGANNAEYFGNLYKGLGYRVFKSDRSEP